MVNASHDVNVAIVFTEVSSEGPFTDFDDATKEGPELPILRKLSDGGLEVAIEAPTLFQRSEIEVKKYVLDDFGRERQVHLGWFAVLVWFDRARRCMVCLRIGHGRCGAWFAEPIATDLLWGKNPFRRGARPVWKGRETLKMKILGNGVHGRHAALIR